MASISEESSYGGGSSRAMIPAPTTRDSRAMSSYSSRTGQSMISRGDSGALTRIPGMDPVTQQPDAAFTAQLALNIAMANANNGCHGCHGHCCCGRFY